MAGLGAKSRMNARRAKAKQAVKKASRKRDNFMASLPKIAECDLLSFQIKHFGDDSRPDLWFVDAETALNHGLDIEDDLGYYDDGVKRTLTDEQIAIFRRSELWQLERQQMRQEEVEAELMTEFQPEPSYPGLDISASRDGSATSVPDAEKTEQFPTSLSESKLLKNAEGDARSAVLSWKQRRSKAAVPYDQRHKRKWENYVEDVHPVEGSLTHRRIARELDDQRQESVEMDY